MSMRSKIMLWSVKDSELSKIQLLRFSDSHKEQDLEAWVESDASILGRDLSIIGRQVYIPKVGPLDLLAVDEGGRLVVIEFKRQQTTRDTIAQILDYASAIQRMDPQELLGLEKIKVEDLKEIVDFDPIMIVVAAEADDATERIVSYLASRAELPIEVVNFTYAKLHDGQEILARLISSPDTPLANKAVKPQSQLEFAKLAEEQGTQKLVEILRSIKLLDWREHAIKRGGGTLRYWIGTPDGDKVVFAINVGGGRWHPPQGSLDVKLYPEVLSDSSNLSIEDVWEQLRTFPVHKESNKGIVLRFSDGPTVERLLKWLQDWDKVRFHIASAQEDETSSN